MEKTFKSIEPLTSNAEKNSRFCIKCGEAVTMLVKYDTKGAIIIEKYCETCAREIKERSAKQSHVGFTIELRFINLIMNYVLIIG